MCAARGVLKLCVQFLCLCAGLCFLYAYTSSFYMQKMAVQMKQGPYLGTNL